MNRFLTLPAESHRFTDPGTGATVRQVTHHTSIHHHPFYYLPAYDDAMTRLFFVSHRTGRPEVWCELRSSGELQQLTNQPDLGEWSAHPSHDGRYVYYTAGTGAWRASTETGQPERLIDFSTIAAHEAGRKDSMVGAAMGTTTLSYDDRYWAVPVKVGAMYHFIVIDTRTGAYEVILERDTIGHPEFHPSDNTLLRYAGPYHSRIWVIKRDGGDNRLVYQRKPYREPHQFEWIVHETWNPARPAEIITARWPHGCIGVDIHSGTTRPVCGFNAWHPAINRRGSVMCADTTFPDIGLQLFDPRDGIGAPRTLCYPVATNEGKHWNTDHCPYDDEEYRQGKWKVYAPQHTHPHPAFSPDGSMIVFTSDRTGYSQVYEVALPAEYNGFQKLDSSLRSV